VKVSTVVLPKLALMASAKETKNVLVVSSKLDRMPFNKADLRLFANLLGWPLAEARARLRFYELSEDVDVSRLYLRLKASGGRWILVALDHRSAKALWGRTAYFEPVFLQGISEGPFGVFGVAVPDFDSKLWRNVETRETAEKFMMHMLGDPNLVFGGISK